MAISRTAKRRVAGVASAKILITSAAVAATLGGWAAIGAASPAEVASAPTGPASQPAQPAAPLFGAQPGAGQAPWPTQRRHRRDQLPGQSAPQQTTPGYSQPTLPRQPAARTHSSR